MAIVWPGKVPAGKIEDRYVSTLDILPTIAGAAGITLSDSSLDGTDLLSGKNDENRLLVWRWGRTWAVRKGDWKLTNTNEYWGKGRPSNLYIKPISNDLSLKLFNLKDDPGERVNLAAKMPEKVKELQEEFDNWVKINSGRY